MFHLLNWWTDKNEIDVFRYTSIWNMDILQQYNMVSFDKRDGVVWQDAFARAVLDPG